MKKMVLSPSCSSTSTNPNEKYMKEKSYKIEKIIENHIYTLRIVQCVSYPGESNIDRPRSILIKRCECAMNRKYCRDCM